MVEFGISPSVACDVGLGGWPLLRVVRGRIDDRTGGGLGPLRADAAAGTRWTSTSSGAATRRACRCSWRWWESGTETSADPDARPCCRTTIACTLSGVPAATRDGEQRQERAARRRAGEYATGPIVWGEPGTTPNTRLTSCCTRARPASRSISCCRRSPESVLSRTSPRRTASRSSWALAFGDPSETEGGRRSPHQHYPGEPTGVLHPVRSA